MDLKFVSYLRKTVFVKRDLILKLYFQLTVSVQKIVYVIVRLCNKQNEMPSYMCCSHIKGVWLKNM